MKLDSFEAAQHDTKISKFCIQKIQNVDYSK